MSADSMPGDQALIYPTETKEYPYEEPFKTAYKFLGHAFEITEIAIVVGYSFRDRGITNMIEEAQSINPNLKIIVISGENPEDDTLKRVPYGSHIIKFNFEIGESANYLVRLKELLKELKKEN